MALAVAVLQVGTQELRVAIVASTELVRLAAVAVAVVLQPVQLLRRMLAEVVAAVLERLMAELDFLVQENQVLAAKEIPVVTDLLMRLRDKVAVAAVLVRLEEMLQVPRIPVRPVLVEMESNRLLAEPCSIMAVAEVVADGVREERLELQVLAVAGLVGVHRSPQLQELITLVVAAVAEVTEAEREEMAVRV